MAKKITFFPRRITIKSKNISNLREVKSVSSKISKKLNNNANTHIIVQMGGEEDSTRNRLLTVVALKQSFENATGKNNYDRISVKFKNNRNIESFYRNMITSANISSDDVKRGMNIDHSKREEQNE